jgi:putative two-component system response regulator
MAFIGRPEAAWERLLAGGYDAVVSDIKMPGMSGLELLSRLQATPATKDIPVIMLTGLDDGGLKSRALELGAADLLHKPVDPADLRARLHNVLRLKAYEDELRAWNHLLEERVRQRTAELFQSRLDIIWRLGKAAEHRDEETGHHVVRVGYFSRAIAEALGMDSAFAETLFLAAPLHDIGKIGIPDGILFKRGPLTPGETATMRQHCHIGARILSEECRIRKAFLRGCGEAAGNVESARNPLVDMAASIAFCHHERWDGKGYPRELAKEQIPPESRIVAVADVYDALTSSRPYRAAYPEHWALEILDEEAIGHFAPDVYAAFLKALPAVREVQRKYADSLAKDAKQTEAAPTEELVCR